MDGCGGRRDPGGLAQEGGLALVTLDEVRLEPGQEGEDEAGKTGARAEIRDAACAGRNERDELSGILDVSFP